jgi:hypothetical protein
MSTLSVLSTREVSYATSQSLNGNWQLLSSLLGPLCRAENPRLTAAVLQHNHNVLNIVVLDGYILIEEEEW